MSLKKMGNSNYSWSKTYNEIKGKHDEAFKVIDEAISLEEQERPNDAVAKYKAGVKLIDEALAIQVQCPDEPDPTWQKACSMIQKIKRTKAEVVLRINSIEQSPNYVPDVPVENPPSYDEAIASSASEDDCPRTYRELAATLHELDSTQNTQELIFMHENVRVYFISPNGEVTSTLNPQTLTISLVKDPQPNTPKAIVQVGTFVYPLIPGLSPYYRTDYGAFILPDLNSSISGSSVGIILPSNAEVDVFDLFESILHDVLSDSTAEKIEKWRKHEEVPEDYSTKISNHIVDGAFYISQNLIRGAMKAGEFFNRTTPKLINKMPEAQNPADIPKPLSKTMEITEKTTNTAAHVTGYVAEKVGHATVKLGQFLAPHIQKQGTKLLTNGFKLSEEEASNKMKNFLTITAGAVEGFSTVYAGLETSAGILGNSLKENTVKIVHHRYGQPASTLTDDTLSTVGNVYSIAHNSKILTPKGLAKRGVKDTGKAVIHGYTASSRASTSYQRMISGSNNESSNTEPSNSGTEESSESEKVIKKG